MREVVIVAGARTAIGDFGGTLRDVPPMDLAQHMIKEVVARGKTQPEQINKVIFGCAFAPIEQNIARNAAQAMLKAAEIGWHPVQLLNNVSQSVGAVLKRRKPVPLPLRETWPAPCSSSPPTHDAVSSPPRYRPRPEYTGAHP